MRLILINYRSMLLLIMISIGIGMPGLGITYYSFAKRLQKEEHI